MYTILSNIDWTIVIIYFAIVLAIGGYFHKGRNSTEYFLAGRNVGWFAIGASIFATNISSEHFIGLTSFGAKSGFAIGNYELLASLIVLILGWVFVPFYLKSGIFTLPEFLEKRYDRASRNYLTTVSIIVYVLTKISVILFAGGLLLNKILGWDIVSSSVVLVLITGLYSIIGGLRAVIYTELLQTIVIIGGALTLTILGLNEVGGFSGLEARLPVDYFKMFKSINHPDFPWTGIIFGAPIIGIWYWCTDQFVVQRVLSAKNINNARSGAILAGFLKILPLFIFVLPGLIAIVLFPEISENDAYPALVTSHLLPNGIRGLVIAGLLAAVMSSLASSFNSTSTLFTMDFYKNYRPNADEKELVLVGRLATAMIVLFGVLWVPLIRNVNSNLFIYLQSIQAYFSPPIAAVFIFGLVSTKLNGRGAIYSLIIGTIIGCLRLILEILFNINDWEVYGLTWFVEMNFLHFAIFLFGVSTIVLFTFSQFRNENSNKNIDGLTFATSHLLHSDYAKSNQSNNRSWNNWNIIFSVILVGLVFSLWVFFY